MSTSVRIRGGIVLTAKAGGEILRGAEILITGNRIAEISPQPREDLSDVPVVDATGYVVVPGFIQTHLHLCQTLFRGEAEDLELLDWLRGIFPLAYSTPMFASALLGVAGRPLGDDGSTWGASAAGEIIRAVGEAGLQACARRDGCQRCTAFGSRHEASIRPPARRRWHGPTTGASGTRSPPVYPPAPRR
jgi:cytosine/adenosine deaminase-related metal-dependent hydrolase